MSRIQTDWRKQSFLNTVNKSMSLVRSKYARPVSTPLILWTRSITWSALQSMSTATDAVASRVAAFGIRWFNDSSNNNDSTHQQCQEHHSQAEQQPRISRTCSIHKPVRSAPPPPDLHTSQATLAPATPLFSRATGCSLNIVFFLKILWFFWTLPVLLQRWWSTCLVCVHTLTPRENRDLPESRIL